MGKYHKGRGRHRGSLEMETLGVTDRGEGLEVEGIKGSLPAALSLAHSHKI